MLLLCSIVKASDGHLCCWSLCFCCCGKLNYWPCLTVNYSQKPGALSMIYIFCSLLYEYLLIWYVTCLESVMKKLVISHLRGEVVCLCFCLHFSLFFCLCLLALSGTGWSRREVEKKKKNDISPLYLEVLLWDLQGENTIRDPLFCPWLPQWWFFFPSHGLVWTDILTFLHRTMILITLHQIVCSRIGRRHCPWVCFVSTLLLSVLFKDWDFLFCLYFKYSAKKTQTFLLK